jgi:hypothetical protein
VLELYGEPLPTHLFVTGGDRFGLRQLIDEIIDSHLTVAVVPEVFEESSPPAISDE